AIGKSDPGVRWRSSSPWSAGGAAQPTRVASNRAAAGSASLGRGAARKAAGQDEEGREVFMEGFLEKAPQHSGAGARQGRRRLTAGRARQGAARAPFQG